MTPDAWDEVEAVFADALELGSLERQALLDIRCAGRPEIRREVESLLASHDAAREFLPVPTGPRVDADNGRDTCVAGTIVGRFRLVQMIGEGGMGVVYLAERADGEFDERVAVKLIPVPAHNADALRRFRVERQILATLNHPDIVTLLDGGISANGQAYLAMKYVEGVPITEYCAERRLELESRLRLFQRVCAAVQYAHQNGIVHRDLKPSNILVGADGIPKVLDFGVAKLLDASGRAVDATGTSLMRPFTPNYASPEQLRGLPVTTACDVYALGVLLYELLTGARPYDTTGKPLDEMLATVVDRQPGRPSGVGASADLPYDRRRLKGDLDAIVLKAMRKEPEHRYASAQELSQDIARHLARQPVLAREPLFTYVLATLARRHRPAFIAAGVSLVALIGALGVSLWQTRIAITERDRAAQRFDDVRQLANALIFKIHDEVQPLAGSTEVRRSIVAEALTYLERLSGDPTADEGLRLELAKAYHRIGRVQGMPNEANLGDRDGGLKSVRKAVGLLQPMVARGTAGRDVTLALGEAQLTLSAILGSLGARDEAVASVRSAIEVTEALVARDASDSAARSLLGDLSLAMAIALGPATSPLPYYQRAAELFEAVLAERSDDVERQRDLARAEKYLGGHYQRTEDWAQALTHHMRAKDLDERRARAEPTNRQAQLDLAIDLGNVAWLHRAAGRLEDAVAGYEHSLDIRRRLAESDPKDEYARGRQAFVNSWLATVYAEIGRTADAIHQGRQAVSLAESMAVDTTSRKALLQYLAMLAELEARDGRPQSACEHLDRAARLARDLKLEADSEAFQRETARLLTRDMGECSRGPVRLPFTVGPYLYSKPSRTP